MKLQIQNAWIDLRTGVHLYVKAGELMINDTGTDASLAPILAEAAKPAKINGTHPAKKAKPAKASNLKPGRRWPVFSGGTENDILAKLAQVTPADEFCPLNRLYAMVRPDTPARQNNAPSNEYQHIRYTLRKMTEDGAIEMRRISPKRTLYRLSPAMRNGQAAQARSH